MHSLPRGDHTLANAWVWWGMNARPKRKIGAVTGEMGCGQHYGGNTADQIQQQAMAMNQMQQQLAMSAAQPWQQQKHGCTALIANCCCIWLISIACFWIWVCWLLMVCWVLK